MGSYVYLLDDENSYKLFSLKSQELPLVSIQVVGSSLRSDGGLYFVETTSTKNGRWLAHRPFRESRKIWAG